MPDAVPFIPRSEYVPTCRRGITHADFARYIPQVLSYVKDALPEVEGEVGDNEVPPGDFLPQWVLKEQELMPWLEALSVLHAGLGSGHPAAVRKKARRRMVFNECLLLSLMMLHHRIAAQLSDSSSLAPVVCKSKVPSSCAVCVWMSLPIDAMHLKLALIVRQAMFQKHQSSCSFLVVAAAHVTKMQRPNSELY